MFSLDALIESCEGLFMSFLILFNKNISRIFLMWVRKSPHVGVCELKLRIPVQVTLLSIYVHLQEN